MTVPFYSRLKKNLKTFCFILFACFTISSIGYLLYFTETTNLKLSNLESKVGDLESKVINLKSRVSYLGFNVSDLERDVSNLKRKEN